MRWFTPVLTVAIGLSLAACAPADAPPPDDDMTPEDTAVATPPDSGTPAGDTAPVPQVMHYDCEGTPVDATFDGHGQVSVAVDGATMVLRTEQAASGAKYTDEAGHVLWTRGAHDALLSRPGHPDRSCTGNPAAA